MTILKQTLFLSAFILLTSCQFSNDKKDKEGKIRVKPTRKYDKPQDFTYTIWSLKYDSIRKEFDTKFSSSEKEIITAINRLDENTVKMADSLLVPNKFDDDFLAYSPFPYQIEKLEDVAKIAIFSYPIQAFGLYEYGELIKWGPTSLGRKFIPHRQDFFLRIGKEKKCKAPWMMNGFYVGILI
jgi:hypothetical protein